MVNKFNFYEEVTLRILGNLNIADGIWEALHYIQQYMPVDEIKIFINKTNTGDIYPFADITPYESKLIQNPEVIELSGYSIQKVNKDSKSPVIMVNNPTKNRLTRKISKRDETPASSYMLISTKIDKYREGIIIFRTNGRVRYNQDNLNLIKFIHRPFEIALQNGLNYFNIIQSKEKLENAKRFFQSRLTSCDKLIGLESGLQDVNQEIRQVANQNFPILIEGELGVEKDAIANRIHSKSLRRKEPFIKINCAEYTENEIGSILFGDRSEKSSFNNLVESGLLEKANHGTLYLKYIDKLKFAHQRRLLDTFQNKKIRNSRHNTEIKLDIRLLCASQNSMEDIIKNDLIQDDFLTYIDQFPIEIPPLRERAGDIPALIKYYAKKFSLELGLDHIPRISSQALDKLMDYQWPGNILELKTLLKRELIVNPQGPLDFSQLPLQKGELAISRKSKESSFLPLDDFITSYLKKVIDHTAGQIEGDQGAAQILKIHPSTLRHKLKKLNISYGRDWKKQ